MFVIKHIFLLVEERSIYIVRLSTCAAEIDAFSVREKMYIVVYLFYIVVYLFNIAVYLFYIVVYLFNIVVYLFYIVVYLCMIILGVLCDHSITWLSCDFVRSSCLLDL